MELEELINDFYKGKTHKFSGVIKVRDIDVVFNAELQRAPNGQLVIMIQMSINKTNVAMNCTYVVDLQNDVIPNVINDLESLVAYLFYGVDKVAKKQTPREKPKEEDE